MTGNKLHPYSIDTNERQIVLFFLAVISILLSYLVSMLIPNIPWYLESPSPFFVYPILIFVFNKYIWKIKIINKLLNTPNINGKYIGKLKSKRDKFENEYRVDLEIIQNWTTINAILKTELSTSHSITGAIFCNEALQITFLYSFHNKPKADSPKTMHPHDGFAEITFEKSLQEADSDYFTGRGREYFGTIKYTKNENE